MPDYSSVYYSGNGSNKVFTIPFSYVEKDDVTVLVGGVAALFEWTTDTTITITTAPPAASNNVFISRVTDIDEPKVDYSDGSTLTAANLDLSVAQLLYAIQELTDRVTALEEQFNELVIEAGNLPTVDNDDNGKILRVVGGVWTLVSPVTQNVIQSVQIDGATYKFQKKTVDLVVLSTANLSGSWVDFHTGAPCS